MVAADAPCDLCSLPVGVKPFSLATAGGPRYFCCEGCLGIYQMLHDIKEMPDVRAQNAADNPERSLK